MTGAVRARTAAGRSVLLPYGAGRVRLHLPADAEVVGPEESVGWCGHPREHGSGPGRVREAIAAGLPRLSARLSGARRIALCVTDGTRATPHRVVLPPLLRALDAAAPRAEVVCVLATGRHRPSGVEAVRAAVRRAAVGRRVRIEVHDADADDLVLVGTAGAGAPVLINRTVATSDVVIGVGAVTPHAEAGFSGGAKVIVPGVAGTATIQALHARAERPLALYARLTGNPFRDFLESAAALLGEVWVCNVGLHACGAVGVARFGPAVGAQRAVARWLADDLGHAPPGPADVLLVGAGGHPYDVDLYQAEGKAWRIGLGAVPARAVILAGSCPGGVGSASFAVALRDPDATDDPHAARKARFLTAALARAEHRFLVSAGLPGWVGRALGAVPAASPQRALDAALDRIPGGRVVVLPNPPLTLLRSPIEEETCDA